MKEEILGKQIKAEKQCHIKNKYQIQIRKGQIKNRTKEH